LIQVDDVLDATPAMDQNIREAIRLIETVRAEASQAAILLFIGHMRDVAREADEAMAGALACLDRTGSIDDESFAKVYAAGSSHATMLMFCHSFEKDPSDHVRLACASGEIVLRQTVISPDYVRVIKAVQERLDARA